jgi:NhaP-type Na+/H+ or K+/H+ antiporter
VDPHILLFVIFGFVVLLATWAPSVIGEAPVSLAILCVGLGALVGLSPLSVAIEANPLENRQLTEFLTELVVIVALMGAGLKVARPFGLHSWALPIRLLAVAMPLTIGALTLLGLGLLGLPLASALLLGAALAPTDPVLASDVQLDPPEPDGDPSDAGDEVRFALTAEAGLNDGLSFPFVHLAIALAIGGGAADVSAWLAHDFVWRVSLGVACGWATGRALGFVAFRLPERSRLAATGDGFAALGATFLAYGVAEAAGGYGFVAVFVAGLVLRAAERRHSYHAALHLFAEQSERLIMLVLLVCFGAAIAQGAVFGALDWRTVIFAAVALFVVRPAIGWLSMMGGSAPARERLIVAIFGIRGLGSFYYIAFALGVADFPNADTVWAAACAAVLGSVLLHGVAATPAMAWLERGRRRANAG